MSNTSPLARSSCVPLRVATTRAMTVHVSPRYEDSPFGPYSHLKPEHTVTEYLRDVYHSQSILLLVPGRWSGLQVEEHGASRTTAQQCSPTDRSPVHTNSYRS